MEVDDDHCQCICEAQALPCRRQFNVTLHYHCDEDDSEDSVLRRVRLYLNRTCRRQFNVTLHYHHDAYDPTLRVRRRMFHLFMNERQTRKSYSIRSY